MFSFSKAERLAHIINEMRRPTDNIKYTAPLHQFVDRSAFWRTSGEEYANATITISPRVVIRCHRTCCCVR